MSNASGTSLSLFPCITSSPRNFVSIAQFYSHCSLFLLLSAPPFYCPTCGNSFTFKSALSRHISSVHKRRRKHSCGQCGKLFSRKEYLRCHFKTKHGCKRWSRDVIQHVMSYNTWCQITRDVISSIAWRHLKHFIVKWLRSDSFDTRVKLCLLFYQDPWVQHELEFLVDLERRNLNNLTVVLC